MPPLYPKICITNQNMSQLIIIPSPGITSAFLIKSHPRFNKPTLRPLQSERLRGFSPGNRKAISREADFANAKSGFILTFGD